MSTQGFLDFDRPEPPPAPPAVDPHLVTALARIHQAQNRALLARLMRGPIETDELDRRDLGWGKRPAARLHDIREWIRRGLGYDGDPVPRRCADEERGLYEWALTDRALELVLQDQEARG